jgi:hypothetical protein
MTTKQESNMGIVPSLIDSASFAIGGQIVKSLNPKIHVKTADLLIFLISDLAVRNTTYLSADNWVSYLPEYQSKNKRNIMISVLYLALKSLADLSKGKTESIFMNNVIKAATALVTNTAVDYAIQDKYT